MLKRPVLDTQLTSAHTGRPSLPACRSWSIDFDGGDLVSTLGEHREDMPRPPVTDLGSRGALVVSGGVSST